MFRIPNQSAGPTAAAGANIIIKPASQMLTTTPPLDECSKQHFIISDHLFSYKRSFSEHDDCLGSVLQIILSRSLPQRQRPDESIGIKILLKAYVERNVESNYVKNKIVVTPRKKYENKFVDTKKQEAL